MPYTFLKGRSRRLRPKAHILDDLLGNPYDVLKVLLGPPYGPYKGPLCRRVDRMLADLCSRTSDDVGYPNMHKNWNFRFFGQISSPSRPFSWIFCQNLDFQKFDLYPYNFELSCSHQFLTDNGQFYHFSKGKSVLRCEI